MLDALGAGLVAGYAIAVPMGPITVLILQVGLRHGLRTALAAAAGAASADGLYATLAGLFGAALVGIIDPVIVPARLAGAALLVIIGLRGLLGGLPPRAGEEAGAEPGGRWGPGERTCCFWG